MKVLKNYLSILILTGIFSMDGLAQTLQKANLQAHDSFQQRMSRYVSIYLAQDNVLDRVKERYTTINVENLTRQELTEKATGLAKTEFVEQHLEEFKKLYMGVKPPSAVTTSVCDNGGFESGFTNYSGEGATFRTGSDNCNPKINDQPVSFSSLTLPTAKRLEIVSSGSDSLTGIQKTKFGSKSLRINSPYGHLMDSCRGDYGVDRIVKTFTVSESNRNFTVWYAASLENPSGHEDQQPFLSITCDLDSSNDLCFDADFLMCEESVEDSLCTFDDVDVIDWTCHRFRIPESEIGNTATLEITVADCGQGGHFGYAYIDGICEECSGSALGSIKLDLPEYCYNDSAAICGEYTLPTLCGLTWSVDSIYVPGFTIKDLDIDETSKTFCFNFPKSNFDTSDCEEIYAEIIFTNGSQDLPAQSSNSIEVCDTNYQRMLKLVQVSSCDPNTAGINISDDYYFVGVQMRNTAGASWTITQELDDPYPDESGIRELMTGSGDDTLQLGYFFIQEGSWNLKIQIGNCLFEESITPPDFCSGCDEFYGAVIDNIQCDENTGEWSFDIFVPEKSGTPSTYTLSTPSQDYTLDKDETETIDGLTLNEECLSITLDGEGNLCLSELEICPPKPCDVSCDLEAYIEEITCEDDMGVDFSVDLKVEDFSGYACYEAKSVSSGSTLSSGSLSGSQIVGTFDEDIYLVVYECANSDCSTGCDPPSCFKVFYVPLPESDLCEEVGALVLDSDDLESSVQRQVQVQPNPFNRDVVTLMSELEKATIEISNSAGEIILTRKINKGQTVLEIEGGSGLYLLRYSDSKNDWKTIKLIKL